MYFYDCTQQRKWWTACKQGRDKSHVVFEYRSITDFVDRTKAADTIEVEKPYQPGRNLADQQRHRTFPGNEQESGNCKIREPPEESMSRRKKTRGHETYPELHSEKARQQKTAI